VYSDRAIWAALEKARMKDKFFASASKLEHGTFGSFFFSLPNYAFVVILQGGSNLSVGERQLLCLARALLRDAKVLCFDEVP